MLNVRLACDHLFRKLLFTWLSLVMSMMVSFVLSFFPRDVLDEILNLIESVSEDFPSYSYCKSRKGNPQKLTQLSSSSHPRHLVGNRTAQKDINIDTTSDSQVNNNFPNRWSPASLTFNNYFYLFLYLYKYR